MNRITINGTIHYKTGEYGRGAEIIQELDIGIIAVKSILESYTVNIIMASNHQ